MKQISVALCTRNGAKYIAEQLTSILNQSLLPAEIVISDDASTDDCIAIAISILGQHNSSNKDKQVNYRVLRNQTPLGVTKNFEKCISECEFETVALSDQDDVWVPNKLEVLSALLETTKSDFIFSDALLVDQNLESLKQSAFSALEITSSEQREMESRDYLSVFLRRNLATGATVLFRSSLFRQAAPFPGSWLHDEWLAIVAALNGRVTSSPEALTLYRQHGLNEVGLSKRNLRFYVGRALFPRQERNKILLARAQALFEYSKRQILDPTVTDRVKSKLEHEKFRSSLPSGRFRRLAPIAVEYRTGRYNQFGIGLRDVFRDLIQPAS